MGLPAQVGLMIGLAYQNIDAAQKARAFDKYRLACTYVRAVAALLGKQVTELEIPEIPVRAKGEDNKAYDLVLMNYYDENYEKVMAGISAYVEDSTDRDSM